MRLKEEEKMKALVCEMCNSTDVVKQDGLFVCQHCGTKYTVEEAQKRMMEGTVTIDNSSFVQKYLENARRAKQKQDWEETEKYYNMVEQNDPSNIEAIFYSAYGKAKSTLPVQDIYKREAVFNALTNSVSILDDNFNAEKSAELIPVLKQITSDVIGLFSSDFVYTQTKNGYGMVTGDDKHKTYQLFINVGCKMINTLDDIAKKLPDTKKAEKVEVRKQQLRLFEYMSNHTAVSAQSRLNFCDKCIVVANMIRSLDPSAKLMDYEYHKQEVQKDINKAKGKGAGKIIGGVLLGILIVLIYIFAVYGYEIGYYIGYNY